MAEAVRIAAPAVLPVSVAEAQMQCRDDGDEQVDLIAIYIAAATELVEHRTGLALAAESWRLCLDEFPAGDIVLPIGPVTSITAFSYLDADGETVELAEVDYEADLHSVEARLRPIDAWPDTGDLMNSVTIEWAAGDACPAALKNAILLLVAHWFDNRTAVGAADMAAELPLGVQALIATKRRFRG